MNNIYIRNFFLISFLSILLSRLIPHPPNFTSTIAIAFYLPALFGIKYVIVALAAFFISDLIIGVHELLIFTWGSIILIGFISKYFSKFHYRILGVIISCLIFYLFSNFGVWLISGIYSKDIIGLYNCYVMGIPFLQNSLIGSLLISLLIEYIITLNIPKKYIKKINSSF